MMAPLSYHAGLWKHKKTNKLLSRSREKHLCLPLGKGGGLDRLGPAFTATTTMDSDEDIKGFLNLYSRVSLQLDGGNFARASDKIYVWHAIIVR